MAEKIEKEIDFGPVPGGNTLRVKLSFRSVVPEVAVPNPPDLSYDFSAAIAEVLGRPEEEWRIQGFGISRSVPMRILHEFYDGVLLYRATQLGILQETLGGLAAHRILVKCLAGLPELIVKYRFYLGIADDDGKYKILTGQGDDLQLLGIQDPYDRLFWLPAGSTRRKIRDEYGPVSVTVKGRREIVVYDDRGALRQVLGFWQCLEELIPERDDPVRRFLGSVYTNVRIPEVHGCRLGDNVLFQLDRLVPGLMTSMNFLFANDLDMPWKRRERGPFTLMLFRLAGARPISESKMRVERQDVLLPLESAAKYY